MQGETRDIDPVFGMLPFHADFTEKNRRTAFLFSSTTKLISLLRVALSCSYYRDKRLYRGILCVSHKRIIFQPLDCAGDATLEGQTVCAREAIIHIPRITSSIDLFAMFDHIVLLIYCAFLFLWMFYTSYRFRSNT